MEEKQEQQNLNQPIKKNSEVVGPLIGTIVVILMLILGAIYIWLSIKEKSQITTPNNFIVEENSEILEEEIILE